MNLRHFFSHFAIGFALSIIGTLAMSASVSAQVTKEKMLKAFELQSAANAKIEAALDRKWKVKFEEISLAELAEMIRDDFQINMKLDVAGLDLAGVSPQDQISGQTHEVPLKMALRSWLLDLDLAIQISDGELVITSTEAAGDQLSQRVYDISHFLPRTVGDAGSVRSASSFDQRASQLTSILTGAVAPESWEENGGTGTISTLAIDKERVLMIVSSTHEVHSGVRALLGEMTAVIDAKNGSGNERSSVSKEQAILPDRQLTTFVYPINDQTMSSEEAVKLIKTVFEGNSLKTDAAACYIKTVGKTVVVRNLKKTQDRIYELLNEAGVLAENPKPRNARGGGMGGGGMGGGMFNIER